jgi:hypothetical protein
MLEEFKQKGSWDAITKYLTSHAELKGILGLQKYAEIARKYCEYHVE